MIAEIIGIVGGSVGLLSLVGVLIIEGRRRRRRKATKDRLVRSLRAGMARKAGSRRCGPADAAQPFMAACVEGCGWHEHAPADSFAGDAARKHAEETGHAVAWGAVEVKA